MMRRIAPLIAALLPLSAAAGETPDALRGAWGTPAQCSRALLAPGGTLHASPFRISASWLEHGGIGCLLTWFPAQRRENGLFAVANALCGEDSAQSWRIDFLLQGDQLHLIWNETLENGPLRRCPAG